MTAKFLVRLKPRPAKPRKGVTRTPGRYTIAGIRFEEAKGWYEIKDAAFAQQLRELTHNDRDDGVLIFDVCTPEQAAAMQSKEKRQRERREVEDAQALAVSPRRAAARRGGAVSTADVDTTDMIDPAPDGEEDETDAPIGKLADGSTQELDDGDDLLEVGGRAPRAPKVTPAPAKAKKTAAPAKAKKTAAPKAAAAPASRRRSTSRASDDATA